MYEEMTKPESKHRFAQDMPNSLVFKYEHTNYNLLELYGRVHDCELDFDNIGIHVLFLLS